MASQKINFVTVNPVSGQGPTAVSISGEKRTGRVAATMTLEVSATSVSETEDIIVNQAAAVESVTANSAQATVNKAGGAVTVTGKSNSTKLTFSLTPNASHPLALVIPATYTAAGKQIANGAVITDDPGASAAYDWSITFSNIAENTSVNELISTLTITAAGAQKATVTITQGEGDPYLTVDKKTVNLDVNGTAQTVNIGTNVEFTIREKVANMLRSMINR